MKKKAKPVLIKDKGASRNCFKICLMVSSLLVAGFAIVLYNVYVSVTKVEDLPVLDLEERWGSGETTNQNDSDIRPYRIVFTEAMQEMLHKKFDFHRSRKKIKSLEENWSYGVNSEAFGKYFAHWVFQYKMRERQRFLNQFDHFKTRIQGLDIHFIHVKPKVEKSVKVYPLLLLHGFPGSVREFYEVIPLLTTERKAYDFVFEVIVPSLPGFVYSDGPVRPGFGPYHAAIVMRNLMHRLGFSQYYVQGGDFGHAIGTNMATLFPEEILGFHTNFPVNFSSLATLTWILGAIWPSLVEKEYVDRMYPLKDKVEFHIEESGYMHLQGTKPDTIGIALQDSPAGLAAYILDKFLIFTNPGYKYLPDGGLSNRSMTDLLDNVMLHWTGGRIASTFRFYKDSFRNSELEQNIARISTSVPTWALRLKHELMYQPDFVLKWKYTNLLGGTTLDFGGHYAAFERPEEFADDVFLAVKHFVEFQMKK